MRRPAVLLCTLWLAAWAGLAHARSFDVQLLRPAPDLTGPYFVMSPADPSVAGDLSAGLLLDYAKDPLVLYGADGSTIATLVDHQLTATFVGAFAVTERLSVGAAIPVVLAQSGQAVSYVPSAPRAGFGAGDLRIVTRYALLGRPAASESTPGLKAALEADLSAPTGKRSSFQGEGFRVEPRVTTELVLPSALRFGASLGYDVRSRAKLLNATVDDMLTWSLGSAYPATERLTVSAELHGGASVLADRFNSADVPLELLVGGKHRTTPFLTLVAGAGAGLVSGAGAPDWRVFVGAALTRPHDAAPSDRDHDGIPDALDRCPDDPEDFDEFEDQDGCPDPDNDHDGIPDAVDRCPNDPEDRDGFQDEDGCPDPDNDGDGIPDAADRCPNDPEDLDGFEDEDGCPDPDNDHDGIPDVADRCPNEPETLNGFEDEDGCPDEGGKVLVTCTKIEIKEKVFFDTAKSTIQARSFGLLDQVAAVLKHASGIKRVRVEGHTDDRGPADYNLGLSRDRAQAVREYLVSHGVEASRLESEGFGKTRPIASNETASGREQNRRVELVIAEQDESANCAQSSAPAGASPAPSTPPRPAAPPGAGPPPSTQTAQ